jgi:hypothetical protein
MYIDHSGNVYMKNNAYAGSGASDQFMVNNPTATYGNISNANLVPDYDDKYECGDPSYRWSLVRGVTITSGDLIFENNFRIVENGTDGLAFVDPQENIIAILDSAGNLKIAGTIQENQTNLGKAPPRKYSGAVTATPGVSATSLNPRKTTTTTTTTTTAAPPPSKPPA